MSSSSGYLTELSSYNSDNSATEKGKNDLDPYKNSGAEQGMPEINEGYTDINDTAHQQSQAKRKRRLPEPPAFKPHRPRNNSTPWFQSCKELCSYCGHSRLISSITLSVLAMAALGVVIYLVVTNIEVHEPPSTSTVTPTPHPPYVCPREGSSGTMKFIMPPVQNPDVLDLVQESLGQNVTILQKVKLNFTDRTWSLDGRDISIWISYTNKGSFQILLNVDISNCQCRHSGKYFALVSGSNGKAEKSLSFNVKAACPCEAAYELNYGRVLVCELKVVGSTTLSFDKVNGTNMKPILYQTGIRIPDNVPERGRFSATWKPDGTLITNINFSPVQCHDEGNYSLTVTSRAGTKVYYIYVKVIGQNLNICTNKELRAYYRKEPTLCIQRGLIGGKESKLQCQASTGCNKANLTVEATEQNRQDYNPWAGNLTQQHYQEGYIWKTNVTLILTTYEVDNLLQNRSFRCTYFMGGTHYYSHRILMKIVPAAFCVIRTPKCLYPHPYDCNKFITCTTIPTETTCPPGQHFLNSSNCDGQCVYPAEAKCNIGESDVGYCEGT